MMFFFAGLSRWPGLKFRERCFICSNQSLFRLLLFRFFFDRRAIAFSQSDNESFIPFAKNLPMPFEPPGRFDRILRMFITELDSLDRNDLNADVEPAPCRILIL